MSDEKRYGYLFGLFTNNDTVMSDNLTLETLNNQYEVINRQKEFMDNLAKELGFENTKELIFSFQNDELTEYQLLKEDVERQKADKELLFKTSNELNDKIDGLEFELFNCKKVLHDFMDIVNEMQYFFKGDKDVYLDCKDYSDLVRLSKKGRDMLENMDMKIK